VREPFFWLGFSILLVAISLTAVLLTAIPAFQELNRAARSAEKLFDTLNKEFPETLEAIRLTNIQLTELTDEVKEGIKSASHTVKQIDNSIVSTKKQVQKATVSTRGFIVGIKAAWKSLRTSEED
jgi:predicted phage-related endonuclease